MNERLVRLLKRIPAIKIYGNVRVTKVSAIITSIGMVQKNCLFVALNGDIEEAIKFGASVIVSQDPPKDNFIGRVVYIHVKNINETLAKLWSIWYSNPSRKIRLIGVTGTTGKSTTSELIYTLFINAGRKVGKLDTTNLNSSQIQSALVEIVKQGCEYAVLEIPLKIIEEYKMSGVKFDVIVFTNLSREELPMRQIYARLFKDVTMSVINRDDPSWRSFKYASKEALVRTYSFRQDAYCKAKKIIYRNGIFEFNLKLERYTHKFSTPKAGEYNISNILASVTAVRFYKVNWEKVIEAVASVV